MFLVANFDKLYQVLTRYNDFGQLNGPNKTYKRGWHNLPLPGHPWILRKPGLFKVGITRCTFHCNLFRNVGKRNSLPI